MGTPRQTVLLEPLDQERPQRIGVVTILLADRVSRTHRRPKSNQRRRRVVTPQARCCACDALQLGVGFGWRKPTSPSKSAGKDRGSVRVRKSHLIAIIQFCCASSIQIRGPSRPLLEIVATTVPVNRSCSRRPPRACPSSCYTAPSCPAWRAQRAPARLRCRIHHAPPWWHCGAASAVRTV